MLRSDAQVRSLKGDSLLDNINTINADVIARIEKELDSCDVVSMVFLLYNVSDTALQRLIVYQRVSQDVGEKNLNLLYDWAIHIQNTKPTWKYEFLEALAICQLYSVIRKLGFNPHNVQQHYLPNNIHRSIYVNPMKKALYKLCENITSDNLHKLKRTLSTYDIETNEYKSCELVLLELMCKKFITVVDIDKGSDKKHQVEDLVKVIRAFPELHSIADDLKDLQRILNNEPTSSKTEPTNAPENKYNSDKKDKEDKCTVEYFDDLFAQIVDYSNDTGGILKTDAKQRTRDAYSIKNPKRVGVCYIINQEEFYPSRDSIETFQSEPLETRHGSIKDKVKLEKTMSSLNFEVISHQNIDHKKMMNCIKDIIKYRVHHDDSMFMLCLMSHGVRGHVYAADSVKIKIDDIQSLLDESFMELKMEIPKIMIIQACQVNNDEEPRIKLAADGPSSYIQKKLNFLVYYATAPELEAFRDETKGSIFIQLLCYIIQMYAKQEHLFDIFTKVNYGVTKICTKLRKDQVPKFESTLTKKLYLQVPE